MKNYEEITTALLRRREEYEAKKKKQRVAFARAGVMVASCALVAALGFHTLPTLPGDDVPLPNYGEEGKHNNRGPNSNLPDPDAPGSPDDQNPDVQGGASNDDRPSVIDPDDDFAIGAWQGKDVTGQLLDWLQSAAAEDVLPLVWGKPGIDMEYVYRGKTLRQYWEASEEERALPERLSALYKMGDSLKYGEALYTTGTPTGEKWEEELYLEVVTYIGQDLLDQYIIEGVFYKEKLWEILQDHEFLHVAQGEWGNAWEAYLEYACSAAKGVLLQQGLEAYHPGNYVGIANITKAQFEALDAEYFAGWTFGMGEDPDASQDMTDTDDVIAGDDVTPDSGWPQFTPDSSKQPGTSADDTDIGVGFDDATRGDQP